MEDVDGFWANAWYLFVGREWTSDKTGLTYSVNNNGITTGLKPIAGIIDISSGGGSGFFKGASYTSKVLKQMGKADDIYHAFPRSVDAFAGKYGKWYTKIGGDGKPYEWLKMPGSYGGKTGIFEYTKDANGLINHRYFNVPKAP